MVSSNSIREFPLDDQMKKHRFKRVYADLSTKQLFVENGKASVTSIYTGDLKTTIDGLRAAVDICNKEGLRLFGGDNSISRLYNSLCEI